MLICYTGLKETVKGEGVWRIRREERSARIEVFKVEESGHGNVLTDEFVKWRSTRVSNVQHVEDGENVNCE